MTPERRRLDVVRRLADHLQQKRRLGCDRTSVAGKIDHAEQRSVRIEQGRRTANELLQGRVIVLFAVDRHRAPLDDRGSDAVRAHDRFRPERTCGEAGGLERTRALAVAEVANDEAVRIGNEDIVVGVACNRAEAVEHWGGEREHIVHFRAARSHFALGEAADRQGAAGIQQILGRATLPRRSDDARDGRFHLPSSPRPPLTRGSHRECR